MTWWLYILIGCVIGLLLGIGIIRIFYFPEQIGSLIIASDPDNANTDYVFMQAYEDPDQTRRRSIVSLKIIDKTGRK